MKIFWHMLAMLFIAAVITYVICVYYIIPRGESYKRICTCEVWQGGLQIAKEQQKTTMCGRNYAGYKESVYYKCGEGVKQ